MEKIILTGGGTAGHITPNIALLPFLKEFEIHYVGQPDSMEQELIGKESGVIFHPLESVKLVRSASLGNLAVPFKLLKAKSEAKKLLSEIKPKVIFSKGGYVALPVMLAAKGIPLILHESDLSMGLANKLVVKKCRFACTSFASTAEQFPNGICTGSPLRQSVYNGKKGTAENICGLRGRKNLLVFGGSLGAAAVNEAVYKAVKNLTEHFDVVHIVGKKNVKTVDCPRYFQIPFTDKIADFFAWADLCVSRGGANALFELAALRKPTLVIPLPKGNSRGDQIDNAKYFEKAGCMRVLLQENLTPDSLLREILELDREKFTLTENMRSLSGVDGTAEIARLIKECASSDL